MWVGSFAMDGYVSISRLDHHFERFPVGGGIAAFVASNGPVHVLVHLYLEAVNCVL